MAALAVTVVYNVAQQMLIRKELSGAYGVCCDMPVTWPSREEEGMAYLLLEDDPYIVIKNIY